MVCFLYFQATKEVPKKTQYPETEHRVSGTCCPIRIKKWLILREVLDLYKRPYLGTCFKYRMIYKAYCICGSRGEETNWLSCWTTKLISGLVIVK